MASGNNLPGARQMSIAWKDLTGNFWMFGGWGYIDPPFGRLNDLWKYNIATNQWTWMAGANATNQSGTYSTMGVGATTNIPGGRRMSISWTDNTGKLWVFGGNGYDYIDSLGLLNDLWMIDIGVANSIISNESVNHFIKIQPNPAIEAISIIGVGDGSNVQIYDSTGKLIIETKFNTNLPICVSEFDAGIYFVLMKTKEGNLLHSKFFKE